MLMVLRPIPMLLLLWYLPRLCRRPYPPLIAQHLFPPLMLPGSSLQAWSEALWEVLRTPSGAFSKLPITTVRQDFLNLYQSTKVCLSTRDDCESHAYHISQDGRSDERDGLRKDNSGPSVDPLQRVHLGITPVVAPEWFTVSHMPSFYRCDAQYTNSLRVGSFFLQGW